MPSLFDSGALELLRRRHRRADSLAMKHYPPVVCSQVVDEYLYAYHRMKASAETLLAVRIFLAPFEILETSKDTPELCAQVRARLQSEGFTPPDAVCWIAAHAIEHRACVVTTDRNFRRLTELEVFLLAPPKTGPARK